MNAWFRDFKKTADPAALYRFLWSLPKGGDLHHHLSGAGFSEWWYELASDINTNGGYQYYTRTAIKSCRGYGSNEFGSNPQYLMFRTIQASTFEKLSSCEQQEYEKLQMLSPEEKQGFLESIRLDKSHEGRNEFFETHWQRLNELPQNPTLVAQILLKNMRAFSLEGLQYLETQVNVQRNLKPDGTLYTEDEALMVYRQMLESEAAQETGVKVKFQYALLRFLPNAEEQLRWIYGYVDNHRDIYVGINMVGREDNDKGHPLRFLPIMREMRQKYPAINLAIHAGEVDEPNFHVRDTLLLGATRIGHGINTITDADTLLLMQHGPYLIEINLISNLLLEYVQDFSQHPFAEYLRTGIPVALSTDDRGMWDSTLTDEYFVAVNEFNLSWDEIVAITRNSILYSFLPDTEKQKQLAELDSRLMAFALARQQNQPLPPASEKRRFICRYEPAVCR
ncbi:adenosine deaminase [Alteromonas pelagimontana]|uniref:Adenosine deaminase n=2 Tax=Alteromonas pelagimontana TaxID=1858656 RepID=A0A6M4MI44_9ALTE|nr:adenosine deaminase [Alteromonas pelagimontana]